MSGTFCGKGVVTDWYRWRRYSIADKCAILFHAFEARAEAEAFSIPNEEVAQQLRHDLRVFQHPIRVSALPTATARDVIRAMQAVEAVRSEVGADLAIKKLPTRLTNELYSGNDYEIDLKK